MSFSTISHKLAEVRATGSGAEQAKSKPNDTFWLRSTLGLGMLGSLLMFAALPPWDLWPMAWIAPVPWLLLTRQDVLRGRRPYLTLWFCGFAFWLAAIHWLRLPHWTTHFGWLALAFYLAFYVPVFVGVSRVAVHRLRIPIVIAAPVVWAGLEYARGHLLSGFTMGSLAHTQVAWTTVIQVADIVGCYGISGLVMFVAACLASAAPWDGKPLAIWPLGAMLAMMIIVLGYGYARMSGDYSRPGPRVALIQGSVIPEIKSDLTQADAVTQEYLELSIAAIQSKPNIDLLVWPETMYRYSMFSFSDDFEPPTDWGYTREEIDRQSRDNLLALQRKFGEAASEKFGELSAPPLLLGVGAVHHSPQKVERYNSALFVDPAGRSLSRYDKMHLVMFGEYIPLADLVPWLYTITPLTDGVARGTKAVSEKFGAVRYAPNICYETVIPHLIRNQVLELKSRGEEPDVLVCLTNDGWFRGSSELDMHLACGVFRAIEMRKPLAIAANTGFSASIDADGKIRQKSKRGAGDFIVDDVPLDSRHSLYLRFGDWFPGLCLLFTLAVSVFGIYCRPRGRTLTAS